MGPGDVFLLRRRWSFFTRWCSVHRLERAVTTSTIMGFIAQMFGVSIRGTGIVFVISLIVFYVVVKLFEQQLHSLPITLPVLISAVLLAILGGTLLRQHYIDSKIADIGEVTDTFHWRLRLCFGKETCIAGVLATLPERVQSRSNDAADELFADQALGAIVRTSRPSLKLLRTLYGVDDRFIGGGESLPSGKTAFTSQRVPEFLVPNYNDRHAGVLVWRLTSDSASRTKGLLDLLATPPVNFQESIDRTRNLIAQQRAGSDRPALVRFAMVPDVDEGSPGLYSGCFGLAARHRVFFSSLDYMLKNTVSVDEAANLSGYKFNAEAQNQHLYVFMFVPTNPSEVFAPTWRSLLTDTKEQAVASPICKIPKGVLQTPGNSLRRQRNSHGARSSLTKSIADIARITAYKLKQTRANQ